MSAAPLTAVSVPHTGSMRTLCLVTETYPPEINGVAMTLERLARGMLARGHRVQLVLPRRGDRIFDCNPAVSVISVPGLPLPGYPALRFGLPWVGAVRALWKRQRPDAIYVATQGPLGWSVLREARRAGVPVVSGFHTNFHEYSRHYGIGWLESSVVRYLRRFHHRTRYTLVPTPRMSERLGELGINNARTLGRGVDTMLFQPARRSALLRDYWGADADAPVLLYVGRLAPEKNLDLVVRAARQALAVEPRTRMVWVGDGPEEKRLRRENPDFVFCGAQRGEALAAHYASGDVFLFPSLTETFGNVILEAMASGLAVAAFNCAAAQLHVRNDVSGVTVEPGDEAAFCHAVVALVRDRARCQHLAAIARQHAEANGWPAVVETFEDLLFGAAAA